MNIKLLVEGGEMKPGPVLSQKLGPAGINIGQVISKVNDATRNFRGLKVPIELEIDLTTKNFEVNVFSPPASELLKKELGIEKGSGLQKKLYAGNASIEQIISVALQKYQNLLSKDLKKAVKTIVGTCVSLGVLVENEHASEIEIQIDEGKFDREISSESTETPKDKKIKLDEYFQQVKAKQEQVIKEEQAAKEAAEAAAKPEAAAAGEVKTEGVKTEAATPEAAKKEAPKKEEKAKKK